MSERNSYLKASIKAAQYLAGLTTSQDLWSETGKVLRNFFGAELCVFGERGSDKHIVLHHWTISERHSVLGDLDAEIRDAVAEVLDGGFLSTRIFASRIPLSVAFFPIVLENRIIAVMAVGHEMSGPFADELLDVYLAVACLVGTAATRLASERELRIHRLELERLVKERTAELSEANGQLQEEIAERRNAEEKLRASDELYSSIFAHIGIGVAVISSEMKIMFLNPVMKKWFPHIDVATRPDCFRSFNVPPRDGICTYCPTAKSLSDGKVHISTTVTPSGVTNRHFRIISTPVFSADGSISAAIEVVEDLTERRHVEELTSLLAAIVESSDDAIISKTLDGIITSWNTGAEKVYGYSAAEVIGRNVSMLVPSGRTDEVSDLTGIVAAGRAVAQHETLRARKDGSIIHVSLSLSPIRDSAGSVIGVSTIARDITARKRVEDELRRLNAYNRSLIEASLDPLVTIGSDGRITDVNVATEEVTGHRRDELIGTDFSEYFTDPEAARAGYMRVFRDGTVRDYPLEILHGDRHTTPVLYNATVYRDESDAIMGVFAAARDITERKQAEAERLEMERRLLHAQKLESLGVLAGGIAHDFNNLLAVIMGDLELAIMGLETNPQVLSRINQALQSTHRAAMLVRQMLAYAGKGHFVLKEIDMNEVVRENVELFRSSVARNITLNISTSPELPLIQADPGQVQQVIMNLIINASEAIGANPGVISLATGFQECDDECLSQNRVDERPLPGLFVYLEVSDTGCGMDVETQRRLFEPFFTTKFTGRGLGMSAVLGIVRSHRGAILLESGVGRGTSFRVLFPVSAEGKVRSHENAVNADRHEIPEALTGMVLVVDDEEMVREMYLTFVRKLGFEAIGAADGMEALKVFRERADQIGLVILDMTMPNMDGVHTFHELRLIRPDVRVVISSGFSEENMSEQFAEERPSGFIQKPFKLEILQYKIAQVMKRNH